MDREIALGIALGVMIFIGGCYGTLGAGDIRGESSYTGYVVDVVEDKGVIFRPSWTNMKTNPRSSDVWKYCIPPERKDELLPKFYKAMEDGGRYTVTYYRPFWVNPAACSTNQAIVTDIREVQND